MSNFTWSVFNGVNYLIFDNQVIASIEICDSYSIGNIEGESIDFNHDSNSLDQMKVKIETMAKKSL